MPSEWPAIPWLWGYLIPIGLLLLIWGGMPTEKARRLTAYAGMSSGIATLVYWAVGFALHMGGAQAIHPDMETLQGLNRLFLLTPGQAETGLFGLAGWFLTGSGEGGLTLFLTYLPVIITGVLFVSLALYGERQGLVVGASALTGGILLPIAACWIWGSGWLSQVGTSLMLGHGFVDFGGTSLILFLPACIATGIVLTRRRTAPRDPRHPVPETYAPLPANIGALVMGLGWIGWSLSQPYHSSGATLSWNQSAVNILIGMASAALISQLYAWLTLGTPEAILASQGFAAGWGAILASAPFVRAWQALIIGVVSGIAFPLVHFLVEQRTHRTNMATVLALGLTAGPIGILSTGLFADGRWGVGWNGVDAGGITGLVVNGNPMQFQAQLLGLAAIGIWGLIWGGLFGLTSRLQPLQDIPETLPSEELIIGQDQPRLPEMPIESEPIPAEAAEADVADDLETEVVNYESEDE